MSWGLALYLTDLRLIVGGVLAVLLVAGEIGWRVGHARSGEAEALRTLVAGVAAALIGFLGLLLGFSLSMAIGRYDARRAVIVEEANAIGTLWLRAGLLDEPLETELRTALRDYVQARLDLGRVGADLAKLRDATRRSSEIQRTVWNVVEKAAVPGIHPAILSALIASANEVIDDDELRRASLENYVPTPIPLLLIAVSAVSIGFLGWSFGAARQRSIVSITALALLVTIVLAVIMDINRPQRGLFQVGDQSIVRLQQSLGLPQTP